MPCLINPRREKGEPLLQGPVLFYINPAEARRACQIAKELGGRRHYLFNGNLWEVGGSDECTFYICGPAVGAPMAVMTLEKLIALGAQKVIACGTCGSLMAGVAIGDVLLPDSMLCDEGVSGHYPLEQVPIVSDNLMAKLGSYLEDMSVPWQRGVVCSTDAPYRETLGQINEYKQGGIHAMDMEFSALLTVASFRQVEFAAIMVVSDQVLDDQWQSGFKNALFKQRMRLVAKGLIDYMYQGNF